MKNTLSSLFKKGDKKSSSSPSPPGESSQQQQTDSTSTAMTYSSSDLSLGGGTYSPTTVNGGGGGSLHHSNSFSGGGLVATLEGSLPENSQICYGTIQTPFNMFELNKRMYQLNSSHLLNKLSNPSTPNSRNNLKNLNGGGVGSNSNASTPRMSNNSGNSSPNLSASNSTGDLNKNTSQQFTITPTLLMGKRNELNKTSLSDKRNSSVSPIPENARSSSPLVTSSTNNNSSNRLSLKKNQLETTQENSTAVSTTFVKSSLSDHEKLIELIVSFLVPHKDWIKSVSNKAEISHIRTVSLLNKKWNQLYLSCQSETVNQLWNALIVELNNCNGDSGGNSETDTAASDLATSKKFIRMYCKLNNLNQSNPSTPTIGSGTISKGSARKTKPMETFNPQDFYSIDLSQLIYQEDPPENMVIVDGQIEHASLNKLIEELTSHVNYDIHFLHTFMLTFRNFTDKETIFKKLEERFNYPPNCPPEEFATFKREVLDKIRLRIINCIKYWIENFFVFDFDNEMMQILNRFIEMVKKSNQNALASVLEKAIDRVKNNDSGKVITQVKCPEVLKLKKGLFNKKKEYNILDYPLLEVARQICLIDYAMFKTIEPKECLNQAWNKEHRVTKAPNISKMIQYFNLLSGYVATEVLRPELELEKRVKTVEKFLELANHCKSLNNFNAVFSIMSGLNSSAVHRLSKVWDAISEESKKIREDLEYLRQGNNFSNLRNVLKNVNPPCVPFNGLFLTDLTFIEDGAPKYINGLINFGKCRLFAKVIRDIQTYQNTRYNFEEYPELKELLLGISKLSDDELFNLSLQIEPRKQKKKKATGASSTAGASASLTKDDDDDDKQKPAMDL